jgi:S-adenosylmethionine-diacylglycerol 3-amino-3-carboxypropyl transferase
MSAITGTVDLNILRYANCWEDADILLEGLSLNPGKKILCVASAGDNALAMLSTNPIEILAIDLSPVQLYLTELKKTAFEHLDHGDILTLLGITDNKEGRVSKFAALESKLSTDCRQYWKNNLHMVSAGLIHSGKFESYFRKFRSIFLPLVHTKKQTAELLQQKTDAEQTAYYNRHWNTWRWKLLMNLFFSKVVMGRYGRDPEFLKHVTLSVPEYIRQRSEKHLQSATCTTNYFLHMIFTGKFGSQLPFYLRKENYEAIRSNIRKLKLQQISAEEAIRSAPYDVYCLSNIFEYFSLEAFTEMIKQHAQHIPQNAQLAYWNLMAPRSFTEALPQMFTLHEEAERLSVNDKGFFYSRFIIEQKL